MTTRTIVISALSATIVELNNEVGLLKVKLRDHEETIHSLQESLDYANGRNDDSYLHQRRLEDKVTMLESELRSLRSQSPALRQKGLDYMATTGKNLRSVSPGEEHRFSKIGAIKAVREVTGFGLKEAKDLVEAYMADHPLDCHDDPAPAKTG